MEEKMDAMLDMIKGLTVEISGLKSEMNDFRSEVNHKFDLVDERFDHVYEKFDHVDKRFDTVELKIDNLSTESRSYFKRLEDRTNTHESVLQKLSYIENVHDGQIAEMQEKMK